jgi:two-component system response regulator ResD
MARVLVVEDDQTLRSVVAGYLERAGHDAATMGTGSAALTALADRPPDLMVLDVMLPELDGLEVCRRVRASHPMLPVIMLTALGETEDRIAGLEVGADDYITKPFSPRELILRIDSVLRRSPLAVGSGPILRIGDVVLDPSSRRVSRGGIELALTARELDLLAFLMAQPGVAFRREELMREVWGWTFGDHSTVTVHVRRLREKLEADPAHPTLIRTVWGVGYRLEPT